MLAEKDSPQRQNNMVNVANMQRDNTGHMAQRESKKAALDSTGFSVLNSVPCKPWLKPTLGFRAPLLCLYCKYPLLISVIILRGFLLLANKSLDQDNPPPLPTGSSGHSFNLFSLGKSTVSYDLLVSFFSRTKFSQCQIPFCPYLLVSSSTFMPKRPRFSRKPSWTTSNLRDPPPSNSIRLCQWVSVIRPQSKSRMAASASSGAC